jgi:hypothetical protein
MSVARVEPLRSPYPYFGGKSRVAPLVWTRLGDVSNYIEPFAGSAAMLLRRPHPPKIETLNDLNCYVANFWRATQHDPESVVVHADGPVNEADLHARHRWLVLSEAATGFRERMRSDPDYFDARVAGWWCWGSCCWIGSGWCETPKSAEWNQTPAEAWGLVGVCGSKDLGRKRPKLSGGAPDSGALGTGVHANGPKSTAEQNRRPFLSCGRSTGDRGINVGPPSDHRPQLADAYARGRGVHGHDQASTCADRREWLLDWFGRLRDRLRTVRVCCGNWRRVCDSHSVTTRLGTTGLFLDPPYPTHAADGTASRTDGLYSSDGSRDELDRLRDEVLAYCAERGADPEMRIAVCGYDTDGYSALEDLGWECVPWKADGGYGNRSKAGQTNAARERLWFSPHCVKPHREPSLFDRWEVGA